MNLFRLSLFSFQSVLYMFYYKHGNYLWVTSASQVRVDVGSISAYIGAAETVKSFTDKQYNQMSKSLSELLNNEYKSWQ